MLDQLRRHVASRPFFYIFGGISLLVLLICHFGWPDSRWHTFKWYGMWLGLTLLGNITAAAVLSGITVADSFRER